MSILVTMQVGPVDWTKFKAAMDHFAAERPAGLHSSRTYRPVSYTHLTLPTNREV